MLRSLGRSLLLLAAATFCAKVGCSPGDLHLLPGGLEAAAGAGGLPGSAGATSEEPTLPPPDCVEPRCETVECSNDPTCKNECKAQLAACAQSCQGDEECPAKSPFCREDGYCARCNRHEHCLLLYQGVRSVCSDGMCLPCAATSQCPEGVECQGGRCGECFYDADCNANQVCVDYRCQAP